MLIINKQGLPITFIPKIGKNIMNNLNQVILVGYLGADAQITTFEGGNKIASFSVGVNDNYTNKEGELVEQVDFINVVLKGKIVGSVEDKLKKGSKAILKGKIKTRSYEKEGVQKYITEVITYDIEVI